MSKMPDDYPKTRKEMLKALGEIREEDIDLSDIPEVTDFAGAERVGDKFKKIGERNLEILNRKIRVG